MATNNPLPKCVEPLVLAHALAGNNEGFAQCSTEYTHLPWLLPLRSLPWQQQWRKPPGPVVLVGLGPGPVVLVGPGPVMPAPGRQRPRTVKWVPLVQTPPRTRRLRHWVRRIRPQARQQTPIRRPWAVTGQERRPGPQPQPQALVASPIDVATTSRRWEAEGAVEFPSLTEIPRT